MLKIIVVKDKIEKANDPNNKNIVAKRDCMKNIDESYFDYKMQKELINRLYFSYL